MMLGSARRLHMGCGESLRPLLTAAGGKPATLKDRVRHSQDPKPDASCLRRKGKSG